MPPEQPQAPLGRSTSSPTASSPASRFSSHLAWSGDHQRSDGRAPHIKSSTSGALANQLPTAAQAPVSPPISQEDPDGRDGQIREQTYYLPQQIRRVARLIQCPRCSRPLREPITLPCGRSLCKTCLPETHRRANISYPGTVGRLQGFTCPFPECSKDHALGDCAVDVTLNKTLSIVQQEVENTALSQAAATTQILVRRGQADVIVDVATKASEDSGSTNIVRSMVASSRFLAMYNLADMGLLRYEEEVTFSQPLADIFSADFDGVVIRQVQGLVRQEMDCQVCYAIFCDPLTTPCGHTFCRHCLCRVFDHATNCPVCRRMLSISAQGLIDRESSPSNELLDSITNTFWADAVELRKKTISSEGRAKDGRIPLFICTLSFPFMPTFLHVFEARYRLMIRRALEGDRLFGMALYKHPRRSTDTDFEELGTVLRIVNAEMLPDGRSLLETIGVSRFRITSHSMVDGYVMADSDKINDISIAEEEEREALETQRARGEQLFLKEAQSPTEIIRRKTPPRNEGELDARSTQELMDFAKEFVNRMRGLSVDWLTNRMLAVYGERPDDPAMFPWWFASILPLNDQEKYRLLATTSVRERLKICCEWILDWETRRWALSDCIIL